MKKNIIYIMTLALSTLVLSGCKTSRHYERNTEYAEALYRSAEESEGSNMANEDWQSIFNDAMLDSLIAEGLRNNFSLQVALEQVKAAEAGFKQSRAALFPSLSANSGHTYSKMSENSQMGLMGARLEAQTFELNLQSSWEIDIWGKLNSAKKAAYADMLATDAARKAVQTRLISDIASAYYSLISLDRKLEITEQTVQSNIDLVETMKILKASGRVTGAALVQSEATRYATEITIPDLKQQISALENTLCILLGRKPGEIKRGKITDQQASDLLNTGIPADLLDNRPDVMQAEYGVISAFEMTNSAKAYFYPSLTISASGGLNSIDLEHLLDPTSFAASIATGLTAPIFARRANKTRLEVAKSQKEQALLNFRNTLLSAGKEVNDAMSTYDASVQKIALREKQIEALERSVEYTQELLNYGSATYTEVLIAQQTYLSAQLQEVDDHIQQLNAVVTLYRALGGGWK